MAIRLTRKMLNSVVAVSDYLTTTPFDFSDADSFQRMAAWAREELARREASKADRDSDGLDSIPDVS